MSEKDTIKFPGFPAYLEKSYWQFPSIINGHVHDLTGAEFKVLWYILRHTFGWQKSSDYISIPQICEGIKRKDGTYLDKGTGLSYVWARKTLDSLERNGFISLEKDTGKTTKVSLKVIPLESIGVPHKQSNGVTPLESNGTIDNTINKPIRSFQENSSLKETTMHDDDTIVLTDDDGYTIPEKKSKTSRNKEALKLQKYYNNEAQEVRKTISRYDSSMAGYTLITKMLKEKSTDDIQEMLDYYIDSKKFDEHPMLTAALSQDSIRRFEEGV